MYNLELPIPNTGIILRPGARIKLGRFETRTWIVLHDWYTYGGNRPVCGWYLLDTENPSIIKPLSKPDLDDIYIVEF